MDCVQPVDKLKRNSMMLESRPTGCSECNDIPILIGDIECKLAKLGGILYAQVAYLIDTPISAEVYLSLLNYKRILEYKQMNPEYCSDYTVDMIASRVNLLIYK